jgi:putative membrane protein
MNDLHGGWGVEMGIGMTIFWIVLIAVIIIIAKSAVSGSSEQTQHTSASALDILKKRYARGEIDEDEFERKKSELKK